MTPDIALIFAISIILLYIKPGPNQAMKITRTLNDGVLPAWFFTLGATTTVIIYFIVAGIMTQLVQQIFNNMAIYFQIIGGGYLLYIGGKAIKNINRGVWQGRNNQTHIDSFIENYSLGLVMTLANPITIFFFIGIVPGFMTFGSLNPLDLFWGICIILLCGNVADILLIMMVDQAKKALSHTKFVQKINLFSACGFMAIGCFFIGTAIFKIL